MQPFQGGRYLQKAPRSRCVAISGGYGPSISTAFGPRCPRGPRRLPGTVLQPFQAGRSAEKATRSGLQPFQGGGVPRRLPGTVLQPFQGGTRGPEGSQERFYRHSQGWGPLEGSQERFCNHSLQPFQGPFQAGRGPQKAPRTPRRLPGAVLQPFQGGRGPRRTLAPRRGRGVCSFNDPLRGVCSL